MVLALAGNLGAAVPAHTAEAPEPISPVPAPPTTDPLRTALGEALFQDPRLSGDGRRTCATCHDLSTNGASARKRDLAPDGRDLALNTNTVFNAALSFRQDWAGQERTLEDQAQVSLSRPDVIGTSPAAAAARIADAPAMLDALVTFERTLLTPDARFDRWLAGDATALSSEELEGYCVFKAVGCAACHQGVNVGGNLFQVHGLFMQVGTAEPRILRVPSLRNVAATPPYFHNGSAPDLKDAIQTMAAAQLGRDLPEAQVTVISAFLRTLTGEFRGHPVTQPAP